ncbi:MAG: endo-1,4-beta-xylanase [Bacteroidales bacterium]|nr:endo-1,4-beta-xylanase [Bacteroidales bacterium]
MKFSAVISMVFLMISLNMAGQNEPVVAEAESGTPGSDYAILSDGDVTYIAPKTNFINATNPGDAIKVASYTVNFTDSGTYKLFVRVRIGPAGADDDSYFYGNGFGTKNPAVDDDWIICNNIHTAGFISKSDVVENQGDAPTGVWKWVSFSDYTGYETPITFRVEQGELSKIFEIGAREDGFDIDKIAFGRAGIYYTVDNLDKGEAGSLFPPGEEPIGPPLAEGLDKFLGCGFGPDSRRDFAGYWNQITPGNAGKWGWVEGTRDNMVWTDYDEAYNLAMDSGFLFKHHVLVWGSQQPSWVAALDPTEQRAELEEWFAAVADNYPGIKQVEVVNEPLHQPPDDTHEGGYIEALGGEGVTGWDWIIEAFRMARAVFADSVALMINEYGIMNSTTNTDEYLKIIKLLQAEDLIDAIGFQGHGFSHTASNETYLRNIDTLASTGLPIYVTELDIDGLTDIQQVRGYMNLFTLLWEHPAIKGITLWGFRPGMWRSEQGAYLIDLEGNERPAMLWLRAYLKGEFVAGESIALSTATGLTSIDADDGTLQMVATVTPEDATLKTVYWKVDNTGVAAIDQNGLLKAISNGTVKVTASSLELNSTAKDEMTITVSGQTGIEDFSGNGNMKIYPNPSEGAIFTVEVLENMIRITVMNLSGEQVYDTGLLRQSTVKLDLGLPAGVYIVRVSDGEIHHHAKIIVK